MMTKPNLYHLFTVAVTGLCFALICACNRLEPHQPTLGATNELQLAQAYLVIPTATITATGDILYGPVTGPFYTIAYGNLLPTPTLPDLPTAAGPTATFGSVIRPGITPSPTNTPLPPTQPVIATASGPAPTFGSVIGPNYTPPPTFTPAPPPTSASAPGTLPPIATSGPSPTPGPVLRSDLMGIQIHGYLKDDQWLQMLQYSQDLGVGWIKVQIPWNEYEPTKGNFTDTYRGMILNIQRASLQGFHTLISIDKAPGWTHPQSASFTENGPPDDPQALADFVQHFVHDCKPEFIDAIEIWNEPNLQREWYGKPLSGAEYMKYFNVAYKAILTEQQAQPSVMKPNHRITILTAGAAPTTTTAQSLNDRDWLQQLYDNGLAHLGNDVAVGVHPYGWANPPESTCCTAQPGVTGWYEHPSFYFRNTIDDYRKIMVRNNHTAAKLWVTEFGWATYDGLRRDNGSPAPPPTGAEWEGFITQQQQADYVLRAFYLAQKPPYYDFMGPMLLWNLNFAAVPKMTDQSREEAGFSLLDNSVHPRPVYATLKNAPKLPPTTQP